MSFRANIYFFVIILLFSSACKRSLVTKEADAPEAYADSEAASHEERDGKDKKFRFEKEEIVSGDTVFLYPYGVQTWLDSTRTGQYQAVYSVWVDTNDRIIDTVNAGKVDRIVVGYNHHYAIEIKRKGKFWFMLNLDKKHDLEALLGSTDAWLQSNLDVFEELLYNERFNTFVVEFSISSRDNVSSLYYIVFNTDGKIEYVGTANSWGGGGADGDPFLTDDGSMYVSCSEIFNFMTGTAMSLGRYAALSEFQSHVDNGSEYIQTHAIRKLPNNRFLVIFNRSHEQPKMNALILRTDSTIVDRFRYYGLIEEMDAVLLYDTIRSVDRAFLYDTEREVLIVIDLAEGKVIREADVNAMQSLRTDRPLPETCHRIDFGYYVSTDFYYEETDSSLYKSMLDSN